MTTERHYHRTLMEAAMDALWPYQGWGTPDPDESVRHGAIAEVLRCIPPLEYEKLRNTIDDWLWFIPDYQEHALCHPIPATVFPEPKPGKVELRPYARMLYLSPILENQTFEYVLAVVAHELAHIALGHSVRVESHEQYDAQEEEAWDLVLAWGFEREAKEHWRHVKWLQSWQKAADSRYSLSNTNYRVILKNGRYAIHEVYYDEDGEPWNCTEDPLWPGGDTLDDFRAEMEHYQRALERPVLGYADLVPDYEPSAPDIEEPF